MAKTATSTNPGFQLTIECGSCKEVGVFLNNYSEDSVPAHISEMVTSIYISLIVAL